MLTADTITDEQIVGLRNQALFDGDFALARMCDDALSTSLAKYEPREHRRARSNCAAILNARAKEAK